MTAPSLSCLICTHRAPASLEVLLDSLRKQEWFPEDEIILIDNGVTAERLAEMEKSLSNLRDAAIKITVAREERLGLTNARLKSFALAGNSWLILLDDDNILASDALQRVRQCLREHPELGGICPQIQPRWESPPPQWVIALGHQVLSYNTSSLLRPSYAFALWKPGVIGARPPGGGMIVHRCAVDEFVKLTELKMAILELGRRGSRLAGGEDFMIYDSLYKMGVPTAYDDSILVYHQIPAWRTRLSYLLRLLYHANFTFGILGIMRFGKWNVFYAGLRGTARLTYELLIQSLSVVSWRIPAAFVVALCGYWLGTWAAFFDRRGIYVPMRGAKLSRPTI